MGKIIIQLDYECENETDGQVALGNLLQRLYDGKEELHFSVFDSDKPEEVQILTARGFYRVNVN